MSTEASVQKVTEKGDDKNMFPDGATEPLTRFPSLSFRDEPCPSLWL